MGKFSRLGEKPPPRVRDMFHIVAKIELSQGHATTKPFANLNRAYPLLSLQWDHALKDL
jgi:hypothetical protein